MASTKKIRCKTLYGEFVDALVYTSGGTLHTVYIKNFRQSTLEKKSFQGIGARDRAYDFAKERHTHWEKLSEELEEESA